MSKKYPRDFKVHQLNDKQFEQWKAGERVTGVIGGSKCIVAQMLMLLGFTELALGPSVLDRIRRRIASRRRS